MPAVFCAPLRYVQGPGVSGQIADQMRAVGLSGPVLVVAGNSAIGRLAPIWAAAFAAAGWTHRVRLCGGESSRREIATLAAEAAGLSARVIVAAGGGKTLDAARAAAAARQIAFVSCPTVCSTDAPTSALSVIYADEGPARGVVEAYDIHARSPDLVLVDTLVIAESPPRYLAAGIGDALSTFYEARAVAAAGRPNMRGGRTTLAALELARLCRDIVLEDGAAALADCRDHRCGRALERVVEATTLLSGLGFESAGLAAAHAVHNGLAAVPSTHAMLHGEKVAFGTLVQLVLEARAAGDGATRSEADAEARRVASFLAGVGLPLTLSDLGLHAAAGPRRDAVAVVAARATAPGETIHNMPFAVDAAAVTAALLAADALGTAVAGATGP
ncbi:MAG: iron-containing alcohol dehydrogenase [Planctomycetia bacterium]|nr:iron-containing alcohol dehydrogenase [Planctomycetia bacterium]